MQGIATPGKPKGGSVSVVGESGTTSPGKKAEVARSSGAPRGSSYSGNQGSAFPFDPGGTRQRSQKTWEWDPTPPHLTTPLRLGNVLPDAPLIAHPDLYQHLDEKAEARWDRPFSMHVQAGRTKHLRTDSNYLRRSLGKGDHGQGEALFILPSATRVQATLQALLDLRKKDVTTSALLLLPEDYTESAEVKTFLHAYCRQGEVYRYGKLFKRTVDGPYLHLNQSFTECTSGKPNTTSEITAGSAAS